MNAMKRIFLPLFLMGMAFLFLFPQVGYAVDYWITDVNIEAFLQEDGNVEVTETHTYEFDGEFNGITREVVPKKGSQIIGLGATENGKALRIEREDDLYKIHRKGEDETIKIAISYTIENGVDVYSDVAEFYWPFFDSRNESTYETLNITVHPPQKTKDVIAFGYDQALGTEEILADGSVHFRLGEVPAGENGDIRVAYDAALFSGAMFAADKIMKDEILNAEKALMEDAAARAEMRETLSGIAVVVIPIFTVLFLLIVIGIIMKERAKRRGVASAIQGTFFVPKEILSLPATVLFTMGTSFRPGEAMSAALLDFVRKGYVEKGENDSFKIAVSRTAKLLKHEDILLKFLFDEIGTGTEFSFDDLKAYTSKGKNHEKYQKFMMEWQAALREELKGKNLYDKNGKTRWLLLVAGLLLVPFIFLLPSYELFGWFATALILSILYLVLAASYITKSWDGLTIALEWKPMGERLQKIGLEDWKKLSDDDQMRAYIYGIGTKNHAIIDKNKEFVEMFNRPLSASAGQHSWNGSLNLNSIILFGPMASMYFHSAYDTTQPATTHSSSSASGGGVGGGGGGSGAF